MEDESERELGNVYDQKLCNIVWGRLRALKWSCVKSKRHSVGEWEYLLPNKERAGLCSEYLLLKYVREKLPELYRSCQESLDVSANPDSEEDSDEEQSWVNIAPRDFLGIWMWLSKKGWTATNKDGGSEVVYVMPGANPANLKDGLNCFFTKSQVFAYFEEEKEKHLANEREMPIPKKLRGRPPNPKKITEKATQVQCIDYWFMECLSQAAVFHDEAKEKGTYPNPYQAEYMRQVDAEMKRKGLHFI